MAYFVLYILPAGILDGTEIPKKDNPFFGTSQRRSYRPGQALSMGGIIKGTDPELAVKGWGRFSVPDEHLGFFKTSLKDKRIWEESTQTIIIDTAKDDISLEDFVDRFTEPEWEAVVDLLDSNQGATKRKAVGYIQYLQARQKVNLESKRIIDGINWLESQGAIGPGRAVEILA